MRFLALRANAGGAIFGLIVLAIPVLIGDWMVVDGMVGQALAAGYPSAQGVVVRSEIVEGRTSKGRKTYTHQLAYEFETGGGRHVGTRRRYYDLKASDRDSALAEQHQYPVGRRVTVRHHPDHPADAILEPGVGTGDAIRLLIALPATILIVGAFMIVLAREAEFDPNDPRHVSEIENGREARLPGRSQRRVFVVVGCGLAVLGGVVLGIRSSSTPVQPAAIVAVAAGALAAGFAATVVFARNVVITSDEITRQLTVAGLGLWGTIQIPFDRISQIDVKSSERRAGRARSRYIVHVCEVSWLDGNQYRRTEIEVFVSEWSARALRQWLLDAVGMVPLDAPYSLPAPAMT